MKSCFKDPSVNFQCFHQRYGELTTHDMDDTYVQETITQGDVLLYHICKISNTNSWIIPEVLVMLRNLVF